MPRIQFTLNGEQVAASYDEDQPLLWVLRDELRKTGTKFGCGEGKCGACTVIVDGDAVRSCNFPAEYAEGSVVETIEGLASNGKLHPVQQAFIDHDGFCCGFCTPGMIMNAVAFLRQNPNPGEDEIIAGMDDNICRCGSYPGIVKAISAAAKELRGGRR